MAVNNSLANTITEMNPEYSQQHIVFSLVHYRTDLNPRPGGTESGKTPYSKRQKEPLKLSESISLGPIKRNSENT